MSRVGVTIRADGVAEIARKLGTILMDADILEGMSGSVGLRFDGKYFRPFVEHWNGGLRVRVELQVAVMGQREGFVVDHVNGDRLDNRRANLRFATRQQNGWNSQKKSGSRTTYKGVRPSGKKWRACIYDGRNQVSLGHFATEIDAAEAYDIAARQRRGEFAAVNFPRDGERSALRQALV